MTVLASWPDLPYDAWSGTCATLHLWLQIVGKISLAQCPWLNHSWHVTLSVTARGLATRLIPHGTMAFQIEFDFVEHRLLVEVSDGRNASLPLEPQSVAAFYRRFMQMLQALNVPVAIRTTCKRRVRSFNITSLMFELLHAPSPTGSPSCSARRSAAQWPPS